MPPAEPTSLGFAPPAGHHVQLVQHVRGWIARCDCGSRSSIRARISLALGALSHR